MKNKSTNKFPKRPPRLKVIFHNQRPLFYITINTYRKKKFLANYQIFNSFFDYCENGKNFGMIIGNFVIMPEHIHLLLWQNQKSCGLKNWAKGLKRVLSKIITNNDIKLPHWQESFFDHLIRNNESYREKSEYINQNPVRADLCDNYEAWPYRGVINTFILD